MCVGFVDLIRYVIYLAIPDILKFFLNLLFLAYKRLMDFMIVFAVEEHGNNTQFRF